MPLPWLLTTRYPLLATDSAYSLLAMSFLRTRPGEARTPETEVLPDGRHRLTRWFELAQNATVPPELDLAYGTADNGELPSGWSTLRLIGKKVTDDLLPRGRDTRPLLVLTYEELPAAAEIQVGANSFTELDDGRTATVQQFLQLASGTYTPIVAGTAGSGALGYLQKEEVENDGTLRRIKRSYVEAGTISQDDESLQGGALLKRTIVSVKTAPSTPSGYTLVGTPVQSPNGLPVYTYTFYKGTGEISRSWEWRQSADAGTNGLRIQRIVYLTTPGAAEPYWAAQTVAGDFEPDFTRIDTAREERDGHRIWTATFANGSGTVISTDETKNGGKLMVYRRVALGAAPSTPAATLGGTVTLIASQTRTETGYVVYDYSYAEGLGEIDRTAETRLSGQLLRTTIRHLTALATSTQPTSDPFTTGGTVTTEGKTDQDGNRIWTVTWTKALSTAYIVDSTTKLNKGKLVHYRRERFGSAPSAPTATISGTVVEIDSSERLEDGFTVYSKTWAEGVGTVTDDVQSRHQGKLKLYHRVALGTAPSAPAATISGVVSLISDDTREDSGVTIYDRTWAEGFGVIAKRTQARDGGLRLETWESLGGASYDDSYMKPTGILMAKDHDDLDGVTRWTVTCMQKSDGTTVDTAVALTFEDYVEFTYPGRAKIFYKDGSYLSITRRSYELFLEPPVASLILATVKVSYTTADDALETLAETLWNPIGNASVFANWVEAATGAPKSRVEGLRGYRSVDDTEITVTAGGSGYDRSVLGNTIQPSTSAKVQVAGGPEEPDGNTYTIGKPRLEPAFVAFDGTQWYRKTVIEATIPDQEALPV